MNRSEAKARLQECGLSEKNAEELIKKAETENCEPTGRIQGENETTIEYKASATHDGRTGVEVFYYPEKSEFTDTLGEPVEDLGNINWVIDHYETW
jgi:hypothetical protein